MEARKLLDAAPFARDTIQALKQAFEVAWASIADSIEPCSVEHTRLSLAHAIVAHAASGETNPDALGATALRSVRNNLPNTPS